MIGSGSGRDDWLLWHRRPEPAPMVAYTVPPVGAGAGVHRELAGSVPEDLAVATVRLPGRERRREEPPVTSIAGAVADLAGRIHADATDHGLPYVIIGDCAASLLGFELARALEEAGAAAAAMVSIAGRAPRHGYRDSARHRLPAARLRDEVAAGGLVPAEITADSAVFGYFEQVVRADLTACETYQWDGRPLARVPVVVLLPGGYLADPRFTSWQEATMAGTRLVAIDTAGKPAVQVTTAMAVPAQLGEQLAELRDQLAGAGAGAGAAAAGPRRPDPRPRLAAGTAGGAPEQVPPGQPGGDRAARRESVREQVAALWRELLPGAAGSDGEGFFEAGGDSIAAVRLRNALQDRLGYAPELELLLRGLSLGELATLAAGQLEAGPVTGAVGC